MQADWSFLDIHQCKLKILPVSFHQGKANMNETHLRFKQPPVLQALVQDFGSLHIQYDENVSVFQ